MIDVLAPLGLVALALLLVAFARAARKQRRERTAVFRELATRHGWRCLEVDDGRAQSLSEGFDNFARFSSPSLGDTPPKPVVAGPVDEGRACVFLHATRRHEGDARQWWVCLVEALEPLGPHLRILPRGVTRVHELGRDPVVSFDDEAFSRAFEVRSPDAEAARACLGPDARERLLAGTERLPFPVEVQIRDRRVAAYPARRNDSVESVQDLEALLALSRELAGTAGR